jgi:hypothetical protein
MSYRSEVMPLLGIRRSDCAQGTTRAPKSERRTPRHRRGTLAHDQQRPALRTVCSLWCMAMMAPPAGVWPVLIGASPSGRPLWVLTNSPRWPSNLNQILTSRLTSFQPLSATMAIEKKTALAHTGHLNMPCYLPRSAQFTSGHVSAGLALRDRGSRRACAVTRH